MVQLLRLCTINAGDLDLIPGAETKIPMAGQQGKKKKFNYTGIDVVL